MTNTFLLLSRLGLSLIFLLSGASKIAGYEATQHSLAASGAGGWSLDALRARAPRAAGLKAAA